MLPLLRSAVATVLIACALPLCAAPLDGTTQLVVVTTADWNATEGTLQAYARTETGWRPQGEAFTVAVGRSGSAWGIGLHPAQKDAPQKVEGDGRSPAGIFAIGEAFGYGDKANTTLPYLPMQESSYCMDVPDSTFYNRIVDAEVVGAEAVEGSTEPMRLDLHNAGDVRYREGFVIEHNPKAVPRAGSCIFAHLWRTPGEATSGCTAMEAPHMTTLLGWLSPAAKPRFVLLPQDEYARLQTAWQLPALKASP